MSGGLESVIRRILSEMMSNLPAGRHAIVQNVDPVRGTVRVSWDEDGTLSGHLPIVQTAVGNGWSAVTMPMPGTQVFCMPDMHDSGSMVVMGAVHSTAMPPGKIVPYKATDGVPLVPGEPTFMGADGQFIRFPKGGGIQSRGVWMHDGDLFQNGNQHVSGTVTVDVDVIAGPQQISGALHRHIEQGIGGLTSRPLSS